MLIYHKSANCIIFLIMARNKIYTYLVDKLTMDNAEILKNALKSIPAVDEVAIKVNSGIVEVNARKEVETEVSMACSVAGCAFRTKVSSRKASYYA